MEIIKNKNDELDQIEDYLSRFEIIILSNQFGPLPFEFIEIYPLCQREWYYEYKRSEIETETLFKYIAAWGSDDNNRNDGVKTTILTQEFANAQISEKFTIPESKLLNSEFQLKAKDVINRIELTIAFINKYCKNVSQIICLRPDKYISEEGYSQNLDHHLIDDIFLILDTMNLTEEGIKLRKISDLSHNL
ncbi:MAG: hypothetical protein GF364_10685 [Candidatus Lokiarchaeota archaeon]|nr:hypothetical protein [Candidatus Lokiarchaeota archaeon]